MPLLMLSNTAVRLDGGGWRDEDPDGASGFRRLRVVVRPGAGGVKSNETITGPYRRLALTSFLAAMLGIV